MDLKLLFLINHEWTNAFWDRVMALLSSLAAWTPVAIVLGGLILWKGGFRARAFVASAVLVVAFNDSVLANSLKHLVHRPRPFQVLDEVRKVELARTTPRFMAALEPAHVVISRPSAPPGDSGRSFPSSHVINTVSVAVIAACFYRRFGWLCFFPSLLVGYSRIYTGSHWPSDVLTSIFLGVGAALLLICLFEWLWRTHGARLLPTVHLQHPSLLPS